MPAEAQVVSLSGPSMRSVPRAVWIGGGLLSLVTAALAGALIMRSVDATPTPLAAAAPAASAAALPVPPSTAAPARAATALVPAKPVHRATTATPPDSTAQARGNVPSGTTRTALCTSCGVVESVSAVQQKGQGTGLGAVAGGVLGGVVGHQVGGGNGKTAMTVLGAIGGGLAGNEVEKRARAETMFDVQVRMEDGSMRTFRRSQAMAVGTHVVVDGSTLRVARDAGNSDAPRMMRTAAPAGGTT